MKVTLKQFETLMQGDLPPLQTLYKWSSKRIVNWLTRVNDAGRRDRELWVDLILYNLWAAARGKRLAPLEGGVRN